MEKLKKILAQYWNNDDIDKIEIIDLTYDYLCYKKSDRFIVGEKTLVIPKTKGIPYLIGSYESASIEFGISGYYFIDVLKKNEEVSNMDIVKVISSSVADINKVVLLKSLTSPSPLRIGPFYIVNPLPLFKKLMDMGVIVSLIREGGHGGYS